MTKEKLYTLFPNFIQNLMVSIFNILAYRKRYGGQYGKLFVLYKQRSIVSRSELYEIQKARFEKFVKGAIQNSTYYRDLYKEVAKPFQIENLHHLPIVDKEMLRSHIDDVIIDTNESLVKVNTGGTTGKSLTVFYLHSDLQERFAILDVFRAKVGYSLGKKTAWFSGKSLLTRRDINKDRFWKTDYIHRVRYYSTFHIKECNLKYYLENLIAFEPEYMVGFPSTIFEIAKYGMAKGSYFPSGVIKAIFPTAETVTHEMRTTIELFFRAKIYNQYASSEGAPFITECEEGNMHVELQSGVFEVLDKDNLPSVSGRLVVTSFTTNATPLIRYDIGDEVVMDDEEKYCACGNKNPIVKEILGRKDDYLYSPEIGKINLGNVSNSLKHIKGIRNFQVIQNSLEALDLYLVVDRNIYSESVEQAFIGNWRDRVGFKMQLNIHYVDDIPVERSGKFRIVKNNIKHLIEG